MGFRFHRVLNIIPGLFRLNLSKSGVSGSAGPRGADINFGRQGVTTNAGIPGTGLSYRQKVGAHGTKLGIGIFIAGLAFAGWKYFEKHPSILSGNTSPTSVATQNVTVAAKPAAGTMYVHRGNSDLRPEPSSSAKPIKKLAKGEKVSLIALSGTWAEVDDAGVKGWVRASILKSTPPDQ